MRRRIGMATIVAASVLGAGGLSAASQQDKTRLRHLAEQVCYDDAMRLCPEFAPDEERVAVCMSGKKAQLSPSCLKVFDAGLKAMRQGENRPSTVGRR